MYLIFNSFLLFFILSTSLSVGQALEATGERAEGIEGEEDPIYLYYQNVQWPNSNLVPTNSEKKISLRNSNDIPILKSEIIAHEQQLNIITDFWSSRQPQRKYFEKSDLKKLYPQLKLNDFEKKGQLSNLETITLVGDVHGDLHALLFPIISRQMAKIDLTDQFVLINPQTGERLSSEQTQLALSNKSPNFIKIPNLIINENGHGQKKREKIIFLGDLLDRGEFSIEVFYLMVDLINQQKAKGMSPDRYLINFIMGNHELMMLRRNYSYFYRYMSDDSNRWNSRFYPFKTEPENIAFLFERLLLNGEISVCLSFNNIFFAHAYPSEYLIHKLNLNMGNLTAKNLSSLFNQRAISTMVMMKAISSSNRESRLDILDELEELGHDGILWIRKKDSEQDPEGQFLPLKEILSVSGHQLLEHPENYGGIAQHLCLDIGQSGAYQEKENYLSRPQYFQMNFKKEGDILFSQFDISEVIRLNHWKFAFESGNSYAPPEKGNHQHHRHHHHHHKKKRR